MSPFDSLLFLFFHTHFQCHTLSFTFTPPLSSSFSYTFFLLLSRSLSYILIIDTLTSFVPIFSLPFSVTVSFSFSQPPFLFPSVVRTLLFVFTESLFFLPVILPFIYTHLPPLSSIFTLSHFYPTLFHLRIHPLSFLFTHLFFLTTHKPCLTVYHSFFFI